MGLIVRMRVFYTGLQPETVVSPARVRAHFNEKGYSDGGCAGDELREKKRYLKFLPTPSTKSKGKPRGRLRKLSRKEGRGWVGGGGCDREDGTRVTHLCEGADRKNLKKKETGEGTRKGRSKENDSEGRTAITVYLPV